MMITKADAMNVDCFESTNHTNADGTPKRYRRNGATKLWKTRPDDFKIPVKHGLYRFGYITQDNAQEFTPA